MKESKKEKKDKNLPHGEPSVRQKVQVLAL